MHPTAAWKGKARADPRIMKDASASSASASSSCDSSSSSSGAGWLLGLRFGMASAVISAIVILLSLRPISRFRFTIVASLLMIALVDSLADGYALLNAVADAGRDATRREAGPAVASIAAKFVVCGSLALAVYYAGRAAGRARSPRYRRRVLLVYGLAAAFVAAQIALTTLSAEPEKRWSEAAVLAGLFAGAVLLSLALRRLLHRIAPEGPAA